MDIKRRKQPGTQAGGRSIHPAYEPYLYSVICAGLLIVAVAIISVVYSHVDPQWLILAFITILTSSYNVKIPGMNSKISIGDTLFFTNLLLFGVPAGVITAAVDGFAASIRSQTRNRRIQYMLFNGATMALSAYVAGSIFFRLSPYGLLSQEIELRIVDLLVPLVVLAFAHYLINSGSVAIIVALEKRKNIFHIWKDSFLWTSITYFAGVAAASFIAITAGGVTAQILGVAVPVLLAVYFTYKTYLKKVEEVRSMAYFDGLTGLPNRTNFKEQLEEALVLTEHQNRMLAVMFLDVDHFKRINDTYGHSVGDMLLRNVTSRLTASIRGSDSEGSSASGGDPDIVIGRFGGDEFTVLMKNIRGHEDTAVVANRFLKSLSIPYSINGQEVTVGATIGISVFPFDGVDADTLLRHADAALYHAKESGRNSYHLYSQSISDTASAKLSMENQLRKALARNEFEVHYQPRIGADGREVLGVEALLRWRHPDRGLLSAYEFIELAEESGLIKPIGEWALRTVCFDLSALIERDVRVVPVAVNFTSFQFRQANLSELITQTIRESSLDPRLLEIELTESAVMENEKYTANFINQFRSLGMKIFIDDFGTGYSSLSRLKSFRLDALKIDKSFVNNCTRDADDRSIINAIISMAHSLGLKVVAEGVETEEQLNLLRDMGCDEFQGFYFSTALPLDQLTGILSGVDVPLSEVLKNRRVPLRLISTGTSADSHRKSDSDRSGVLAI